MKKLILLAALGAFSIGDVNAQFALQNFNSATLPAGWSMIKVDNNTPGTGLNSWIVSQLTTNAWMLRTRAANDSCMLTTSMFTPAGTADRWLLTPQFMVNDPNMVLTWEDAAGIDGVTDSLEVWIAPGGGNTVPDFTAMGYQAPVGPLLVYTTHGVALGAYNGQNIRVAFRNHSTNKGTLRLDNVQSQVPANVLDASAESITFPKLNGPTSNNTVKVDVKNNGAQNITTMTMTYTVDGGPPVSQNFTGLSIPPYGTSTVTFTQPVVNPAAGAHTLAVAITLVNAVADPIAGNNTANTTFAVATQIVQRNGLIEEFSSSTCAPCASFNASFDPLVSTAPVSANVPASNFNVIKYQMNWPPPGNDRSYNAHGATRQAFYGVNSIPDHYTNGMLGGSGNLAEITASKAAPAYLAITGTYEMNSNNTFDVAYSVTPYFTITGSYSIHAAAVQREYDLALTDPSQTTSQTHFVFAQRQMYPSGSGTPVTSWTGGTPVTGTWNNTPFAHGGAAPGNFQFWSHPMYSDLVVFVQDNTTKEILQSQVIQPSFPADVPTIANDTKVLLFPNPAVDYTVISLEMNEATTVNINVTDALGRVVYTKSEKLAGGRHNLPISTTELAAGAYHVTIQTEKGSLTQRLSVIK